MADTHEISQLILRERQGRDRGWWDQMRDAFFPDSTVNLSWFSGGGHEFVARSAEMNGRGDRAVHRLSPPVVHVDGHRAYAEVSTAVELRVTFDTRPADLISYTRLNYRLERRNVRWGVISLDAIYERDTLTPAVPGQGIVIDPGALAGFRPSYSLIAYHLAQRGYTIGPDLLGDDRPDEVDAFYAAVWAWLKDEPANS
jgi:hypothetical protein